MGETVVIRVRTTASADRVRRACTDAAELGTWFAEHAAVELPDRFEFWGRHTPEGDEPRQIPEHADDRSLRFSWLVGGEKTAVELSWAPNGDDTRSSRCRRATSPAGRRPSRRPACSGSSIPGGRCRWPTWSTTSKAAR